jgi:hypothetical protein
MGQGGTEPFIYGNENTHHHLGTGFFIRKGIILTFKGVDFFKTSNNVM